MQMRSPGMQFLRTPSSRPCSSRRSSSTRARPYIGALRERSKSSREAQPPTWDPSQALDPDVWAGCWRLRPLRDPGFRSLLSQPSGRQTGREDGALEGDSD